ncbi:hypothetical protein UWK_01658 [Desulfocapsa sulfexigens DSM 10523]|uniref:Uncharacterized protein n=1 Tax=Desulfocapsa sulfexigens (strain DSM 10523 / SB164P1) TaxID=1167006 RepID=M1PP66_DESSD|nr:hypothetical protein [Desulfocapsa sulfexigens]AGF78216.1 hypothetical protein UWK_01658 [Desulfocapsa sulfexigens DSM 10523]
MDIYQTKIFSRQLSRLEKSDKKGASASRQAGKIIASLRHRNDAFQEFRYKQTKHGEHRLDNVIKYDLGSGYRLITVWEEECVLLAYVGSHDDCHMWLENNKNTSLDKSSFRISCTLIPPSPPCKDQTSEIPSAPSTKEDPYEEELLQRIDDKTLRSIFRGLCRNT